MPEVQPQFFQGPLLVTVAYLATYYAFMGRLLATKNRLGAEAAQAGERFDRYESKDPRLRAADRSVGNMLEQMPPFLCLLWLDAVFVSVPGATLLGAIYVCSRIAYPFLVGPRLGRGIPARVLLSTVTGYVVLLAFGARIAWQVLKP